MITDDDDNNNLHFDEANEEERTSLKDPNRKKKKKKKKKKREHEQYPKVNFAIFALGFSLLLVVTGVAALYVFLLGGFDGTVQALVDSDTPYNVLNTTDFYGQQFSLVFSDEFNKDGRSFGGNDDRFWEAIDHYNPSTQDLEYYSPSQVTTEGGSMVITASNSATNGYQYTSGMVQSWDRLCFTGGIVELNVSLPGNSTQPGLWPAIWMLGNLGRASWTNSTDNMWPWTYDECNSASTNGGQKISRCDAMPLEWGMLPFQGRGSPEIDILESKVSVNDQGQSVAQLFSTLHFAPKNPINCTYDHGVFSGNSTSWYADGDIYHDYIGGITEIDQSFFSGFHIYRLEWEPLSSIRWLLDGHLLLEIDQDALSPQHNAAGESVGRRMISVEPTYLLFNLALSDSWSTPPSDLQFPATMKIDYVRVYQRPGMEQISCNPILFPTEDYIQANSDLFS